MGRVEGDTHLVVSTRELPDVLAPQESPIG
jgi:hypothetical protein